MAYSCKAQYPTLAGNIERFKKQTDLESHCYDAKVTVSKSSGNVTCELNLLTATPYSRLDREQVLAEIPGLFKGISPVLEGADVECTHVPTKDHRYTATAMIKKAIQ
jgi:hypothetical protein